jgi:hypothetical protein
MYRLEIVRAEHQNDERERRIDFDTLLDTVEAVSPRLEWIIPGGSAAIQTVLDHAHCKSGAKQLRFEYSGPSLRKCQPAPRARNDAPAQRVAIDEYLIAHRADSLRRNPVAPAPIGAEKYQERPSPSPIVLSGGTRRIAVTTHPVPAQLTSTTDGATGMPRPFCTGTRAAVSGYDDRPTADRGSYRVRAVGRKPPLTPERAIGALHLTARIACLRRRHQLATEATPPSRKVMLQGHLIKDGERGQNVRTRHGISGGYVGWKRQLASSTHTTLGSHEESSY